MPMENLARAPADARHARRRQQHHRAGLAAGGVQHTPARTDTDLDAVLSSFATTLKDRELRATHRPKATPRRDWRTCKDPVEAVVVEGRAWFDKPSEQRVVIAVNQKM